MPVISRSASTALVPVVSLVHQRVIMPNPYIRHGIKCGSLTLKSFLSTLIKYSLFGIFIMVNISNTHRTKLLH